MLILALLFLVTALLYASVGFGGGSTYNALLVLADTDYRILPSVALACNLIVVAGGVWQYRRSGQPSVGFALPFVALSIPMAWFGGSDALRLAEPKRVAVLIGGQMGSRLSTRVLSGRVAKRLTALLVLYVAGRLLYMSFA